MSLKNNIPNILTLANLVCGFMAISMEFSERHAMAAGFIFLAAGLDFFDGLAARLLKVTSDIGKDLDSLSDIVSFGVAPGFILFGMLNSSAQMPAISIMDIQIIPLIALGVPLMSALRLARFNNDKRQADYFLGLPTPACGIFIASLSLIWINTDNSSDILRVFFINAMADYRVLVVLAAVLSLLLVLPLPLLAFKFRKSGLAENKAKFVFLSLSLLLLLTFRFSAAPLIFLLYFIVSFIFPPDKQVKANPSGN